MRIFLNEQLVDENLARIPVFDRGLLFADGLYETLRTYDGRIFALAAHLERLAEGCAVLRIPRDTSEAWWRPRIESLVSANGLAGRDSRLRITVTRGANPDIRALAAPEPLVAIFANPIEQRPIDERRRRGTAAVLVSIRRVPAEPIYQIKTLSLGHTILAQIECSDAAAGDAIFCNTRDEICEATTANVFVVGGRTLATPPVDAPCLPGVTRRYLLEAAAERGFSVCERPVTVAEMLAAEEVFTCASVSEVHSIISVDGRAIGTGKPGAVADEIQGWWRAYAASKSH